MLPVVVDTQAFPPLDGTDSPKNQSLCDLKDLGWEPHATLYMNDLLTDSNVPTVILDIRGIGVCMVIFRCRGH